MRQYKFIPRTARQRGLTLIELMVVVAIIAILAAIGYPQFAGYVNKSHRADAQSALLEAAQRMENNLIRATGAPVYNQYVNSSGTTVTISAGDAITSHWSDFTGRDVLNYYNITISAIGANTFTLQAAPKSTNSDKCKTLTLTNTGIRGSTGSCNW